jgi:hypothetical protein
MFYCTEKKTNLDDKKLSKFVKVVVVGRFFVHFVPDMGGCWS